MRRARAAATLALGLASLAACASLADLDVTYGPPAAATLDGGADAAEGGSSDRATVRPPVVDGAPPPPPSRAPPTSISGCAEDASVVSGIDERCDLTAGLGCCVGASSEANQCLSLDAIATGCAGGKLFVGCQASSFESPCCIRTTGARTTFLRGSDCADGGAFACLADDDCPEGTGACRVATCAGVRVGRCGGEAPPCP